MKGYTLLIWIFVSAYSFAQPSKVVNKIVAQVGDNIILLSDIESQLLQAEQGQVKVTEAMECGILEQLMIQELLIKQCLCNYFVFAARTNQ